MAEKKTGMSRREFFKIGGVAGMALQVGAIGGAALEAGKDKHSYIGWADSEGTTTQFVDRKKLEINFPAYQKVSEARRPARETEYVFGRAYRFRMALRATEDKPGWTPEDGVEALGEPLATFYQENPDILELDLKREREIFPKAMQDHEKYDPFFRLADAWSDGWADVFRHYPPHPKGPPTEFDFKNVNPTPLVPRSGEHAAELIKTVAHHYGASLVGICKLNPDWVYDKHVIGGERGEFEVPEHWEYAIAIGIPMEWDQVLSNPAHGTSYDAYARCAIAGGRLVAFIKSLGYPARAHVPPGTYDLIVPPILVDAGIGQQGRHGFVISPETGANLRAAVVTTSLPMQIDKPIDFGVTDFCQTCKICAEQCPSGSISFADTCNGMTTRGYEHWEINSTSCYNFWESSMGPRGCRLCVATCPYSRKHNWAHELVRDISSVDPTGAADRAMIWMQKKFFEAPGPEAYLPPPDGRFAGYRPAPEWLDVEHWFEGQVLNPQLGE